MGTPGDHTSLGGAGGTFPSTEWTRLLRGPQTEAVLAELYQRYWRPIYRYLRGMGFGNEQAKDLVQGFFTDKVLGQSLVQKADREKGRFRSFLLRAVHNYSVSIRRADKACLPLDPDQEDGHTEVGPEDQFNRAWADNLLQEVLKELEAECSRRDKGTHWALFRDWLLAPGAEKMMEHLCRRHGVADPATAYHMIENVKRRFRSILRNHLGQYAGSDVEIEAEIREFIGVFSRDSART
ncbi:MAG: sigma-70 family RNA polymerase sigma factor [Phycisphaerae bacterium]|nr:sigma-70 family RNA polymerase sigma factor [Phycisphaerae bacterium]